MFRYKTGVIPFFLTLLLTFALVFFISCKSGDDDENFPDDIEEIVLDYSVQSLGEDLKWITNDREPLIASSKAKKGGTFNLYILTFPLTFRVVGPDSNNFTRSYFLNNQLSLVGFHPDTEKILPELATHWAYGKDGRTMYFKLHPDAKWSDGEPVKPEDFVYTLEFMRSRYIRAPWYNDYYTKEIESVKIYSDNIISVTAAKKSPDLWLTTNLSPTPKHFYGKLNKSFVRDYNWKIEPNTGPYVLKDYSKGKYLLFERKKDWWAADLRYYKNRYNVDYFKLNVIRDVNVAYEHFRKGQLDTFGATRPSIWHEKAQGEIFNKGYAHRLWFYNDTRRPTWGLYLNFEKEIFKDLNLRYALAHAINFDKVNRQILRGEAVRLHTFYSGYGAYTNSRIKAREFNISRVEKYMRGAGWERGSDGIWEKDGSRYSVTLTYGQELFTPRVVVMKEEAKKAGIELNLELLDASTSYKKIMEKMHDIAYMGWSTSFRPSPWQSFHSENANKPQTNNINNMNDPEMDALIHQYRDSIDEKELIRLSHRIQEKIHELGGWIPLDTVPFFRSVYWRWIEIPDVPGYKTTSDIFDDPSAGGYFWIDEDIKRETLEAMRTGKSFQPVTRVITKYKRK